MPYPSNPSNANYASLPPSTNGCISSSSRARSDGLTHEHAVEAIRPRVLVVLRGRVLSTYSSCFVPFATSPRLFYGTRQSSRTAHSPTLSINCSSQGPRTAPYPEPLASPHSSASTSLVHRWASSPALIGHMLDIQFRIALHVTYFQLLQKPETFINSPIPSIKCCPKTA